MPTASPTRTAAPAADATSARVIIVGTGFAGLGMAARLKRAGMDDFLLLERAHDVGGTWRDNTYPGCACDVPSADLPSSDIRVLAVEKAPDPSR